MESIESRMSGEGDMRISNPLKDGQWWPIKAMTMLSYLFTKLVIPYQLETIIVLFMLYLFSNCRIVWLYEHSSLLQQVWRVKSTNCSAHRKFVPNCKGLCRISQMLEYGGAQIWPLQNPKFWTMTVKIGHHFTIDHHGNLPAMLFSGHAIKLDW